MKTTRSGIISVFFSKMSITIAMTAILTMGPLVSDSTGTNVGNPSDEVLGIITVTGGETDFSDIIVSQKLPENVNAWRPLVLFEVTGNLQQPVPVQVANSAESDDQRIWFPVSGTLAAGEKRQFELRYGAPLQDEGIQLTINDKEIRFEENDQTLLVYNHGHIVPPEGLDPRFIRSGYIHPVYSPSGLLVTQDMPSDHAHHKGVWFPWTRTEFEGREVDFWNLRAEEGTVQFAGIESTQAGPVFSGVRVRHEFVDLTQPDGGKIALNETWDIKAWANETDDYLWDLTSTQQTATESALKLLEYHYGGLGFRGAKEWVDDNHVIHTSEGHTKEDGHTERSRWVAHSGEINDGEWATVVIMVHPENIRYPEPMRIWASGGSFFCYSPVQLGDWTLEPGNDYVFRYRFWVYDGKIDAREAERMWRQFAHPPEVSWE